MHSTGTPDQQLPAQPLFQTTDLFAKGWLGDVEDLCGAPEVELFRENQK